MPHRHVFFPAIARTFHIGPPEQGAEDDRCGGDDIDAAHAFQHAFGQEFFVGECDQNGDRRCNNHGGCKASPF